MEPVYRSVIGLITTGFRAYSWPVTVRGVEHVPATGGAVLATNHIGYLDFTFVGYAAGDRGRLVRFLAKKEIFDKPGVGWLMRGMRHVPVDRYGRAADSYSAALTALQAGEVIGMFPEATISTSFVPAAGKTGAARMAMAAGVPLVPGAVWGSQRLLTKGRPRNLQRGVAITVLFGAPIPYTPGEDPATVTKRLMTRITELVAEAQATYPQQPEGDDDRWWLPSHLGGTAPSVAASDAAAQAASAQRRAQRRASKSA